MEEGQESLAPLCVTTSEKELETFSVYNPSPTAECDIVASLCEFCRVLIKILLTEPFDDNAQEWCHTHHDTKERLVASASNCSICHLISQEVDYLEFMSYRIKSCSKFPALLFIGGMGSDVYLKLCGVKDAMYSSSNKVIVKHPLRNAQCLVPVPEAYPITSDIIATVLNWLDGCVANHETCASMRKITPLPKRVLDISEACRNSVRLCESSGEIAPYVTVSYCWGSGVTLTTTQTNLKQHMEKISLTAFPETLRDAIQLAHGLGFRYIWIDALCIVQDDALDWTQQSRQMTTIYQGGTLNIAMTDARNSNSGAVRRLNDCGVCIGSVSSPSSKPNNGGNPGGSKISIHAVISSATSSSFHDGNCRLETRGWVFQETLVSVASLYITHEGFEWHCCTNSCQPGEEPVSPTTMISPVVVLRPKAAWARHHKRWAKLALEQSPRNHSEAPIKRLRELYAWVSRISRRRLSKFEDKLPCIAGLVSQLAGVEGSYLAGLWREDLAVGLTWRASSSGTLTRRTDSTPSWTWASTNGPVGYMWFFIPDSRHSASIRRREGYDIEIIDAWADEVHPGSFGEVCGGQIVMSGMTWPVKLSGNGRRVKIADVFGKDLEFTVDEARDWGDGSESFIFYVAEVFLGRASRKKAGPYILFLVIEKTGLRDHEFRRIGLAVMNLSVSRTCSNNQVKRVLEKIQTTGDRQKILLV